MKSSLSRWWVGHCILASLTVIGCALDGFSGERSNTQQAAVSKQTALAGSGTGRSDRSPANAPLAQPGTDVLRPAAPPQAAGTAQADNADSNVTASKESMSQALNWAKDHLPDIESLADYSATLVKRERIDGKLQPEQRFFVKIRHKPFSVYSRGLAPPGVAGQEAIYVAGQNDGKMWAHLGGPQSVKTHALLLKTDGWIVMHDQRYPITEIGLASMLKHLIACGERDGQDQDCQVKFLSGCKVENQTCMGFEVLHPKEASGLKFHLARIFVDEQYKYPVRYEAYSWPLTPGGSPQLEEAYSYLDLKVNNGFTDADFSTKNPAYHFH
jgi:hypothetical protein